MTRTTIEAWLTTLGLPQYADLFEENGLDFEILSEVTDAHLRELGVKALGHRLKLVKAIAALGAPLAEPDIRASKASDALTGMAMAERRQLTIMFCDLVGSTALSARIDVEDYRDLMTLYQETVSNVVTKAGGHVAKYLGDGVLIYFGYPIAQEDAAERATRAGFEIIDAVAGLDPVAGARLQVRLGVATGLVVVGDLVGDGVEEASAVAGETPNLAARLQGLAKPGQIVIGDITHDLLGQMFVYEALEDVHMKGFDASQGAWRVLSEAHSQERFTMAAGREKLSPLVGRDEERARLMAAWEDAKSGSGRVFLISGDAGIGKSRLSHEIVEQAYRDNARVLNFQTAQYFTNTAFYPVRRQSEYVLDFSAEDSADQKLDKLENLVLAEADLDEARALMASLLSLPVDRYPALNLSPALQKTRTIEMLLEQVILLCTQSPILVYFEDLHWIDPTSLELLGTLVERLKGFPILLLATFRPEFSHSWEGAHIEQCDISRLTTQDIEALLDNLTDGMGFSATQRAQLLARSDGVPLFAEELTRYILDAKRDPDEEQVVPDSLQDSLMARLDKLGSTRELAQIGAVVGREFDTELMSHVTGLSPRDVTAAMGQLVAADLVDPSHGEDTWTFRHALLQEAAYRSMLRRRRQDLHLKIATTLEEQFPDRCETGPEQVAHHFVAANLGARSVPYWLSAGKMAWARVSAQEALSSLGRGLEYVARIEDADARAKLELQLQSTIGVVHFAATSYASPQAAEAFQRAQELSPQVEDADLRVAVLYGIGAYETMRGDVGAGQVTFNSLSEEALRSGNARYEIYSASMQAWSCFNRGEYAESARNGQRVLALYDQGLWDQPGPRLSAAEPKVISECFRATALWSLGYPDQAVEVGDGILNYARTLPDPYSLVYALSNGVVRVSDWNGDWDRVLDLTEECSKIAGEYGYGFLGLWGNFWRARAMAHQGKLEEAEKMTATAVAACKKAGVHYHRVGFEASHARQLLALGRVDEAADVLSPLDMQLLTGGEMHHEVDLLLALAEVALAKGNRGEARTLYDQAMASAKSRDALSWQLRAALGLASLAEDKVAQNALLEPLLAQFTEGFDTLDMNAAKAILH